MKIPVSKRFKNEIQLETINDSAKRFKLNNRVIFITDIDKELD